MKRTALKRGSEIRRKTPLRSASEPGRKPMRRKAKPLSSTKRPSARHKPAKRQRMNDKRFRSEAYLAWVRQQPCAFCHLGPCDAHHVIGLGWQLSGMGLTAPDSFAMPLCRTHHRLVHDDPSMQPSQVHWLRWTIRAALAEFTGETREELTHALAFIESKEMA